MSTADSAPNTTAASAPVMPEHDASRDDVRLVDLAAHERLALVMAITRYGRHTGLGPREVDRLAQRIASARARTDDSAASTIHGTPGSWSVMVMGTEEPGEANVWQISAGSRWIMRVQHNSSQTLTQQRVNMATLVAAPAMLGALQRYMDCDPAWQVGGDTPYKQACAAIDTIVTVDQLTDSAPLEHLAQRIVKAEHRTDPAPQPTGDSEAVQEAWRQRDQNPPATPANRRMIDNPPATIAADAERHAPRDIQAVAQYASDITRIIDRLTTDAGHDARCATAWQSAEHEERAERQLAIAARRAQALLELLSEGSFATELLTTSGEAADARRLRPGDRITSDRS